MAFIKAQKIVRDENGTITSGSAAIVDTAYVSTGQKNHSKQTVREKLGKVLYLSEDRKSGIFMSPTRGLVEYDSVSDTFEGVDREDPRIRSKELFPDAEIHTVFGDTFLLFLFLEKCGLIRILRTVFPKDEAYERVLCHLLHGVLKDGSRISCDNFLRKSFASYILRDIPASSLHSDTQFFTLMKQDPSFGKGCYVDSTPLPNDIDNNPFNALCCHGVSSSEVMTRLILVLDEKTGLPVWYDIIPGNVLDINTVMTIVNDVADTLKVEIDSLVLDAGYVSKELIEAFHIGTEKTIIGRMPARKGYPYKTLYWEVKDLFGKGKYAFVRKHHAYFGIKKRITLFEKPVFAYVYVDQYNALKRFSDYLVDYEEDFAGLKAKDKDWYMVRYGYFVLISNIDSSPKELLSEYFGRTDVEVVFKTAKEYLDLLPLSKWTDTTVRGKILHDIINTTTLLLLRKSMKQSGLSTSEIIGRCQSLMCCRKKDGTITIETPSKQVKEYYKLFKLTIPAHVKEDECRKAIGLKM